MDPRLQSGLGGALRVNPPESHDNGLPEEAILGLQGDERGWHGCCGPQADPVKGLDSRVTDRWVTETGDKGQDSAASIAGDFPQRLRGAAADMAAAVAPRS